MKRPRIKPGTKPNPPQIPLTPHQEDIIRAALATGRTKTEAATYARTTPKMVERLLAGRRA